MPSALEVHRIQALCFDVDGTISDTDDHIVAKLADLLVCVPWVTGRRATFWARGIVMQAETPVNWLYSFADRLGLDTLVVGLRGLKSRLRHQRLRKHRGGPETVDEIPHDMVPGVREMLLKLAERYPMSVLSTGGVARIERFLQHHQVRDIFTAVVGGQTTRRMKPFPDPLFYAAEQMKVAPENCLMIGDTTVDMLTAKASGAQALGVLCGFGTEDELLRTGAAVILPTTSDLLRILMPEQDDLKKSDEPAPPRE